jgi:hypothetical protein
VRIVLPAARALDVDLAALAAALFFRLHPLRVESVAWVTERRDVVSGLFYVLTLLFWVRHAARGELRWGRDAMLACACLLLRCWARARACSCRWRCSSSTCSRWRRWKRVGGAHGAAELVLEKLPLLVLGFVFAGVAYWGSPGCRRR